MQYEDDRVIREVPVFISRTFANQLYVIQYPLTPLDVPRGDSNIIQAKIKPDQDKIQLTVEVDTKVRYDKRTEKELLRQVSKDPTEEAGEPDRSTTSNETNETNPEVTEIQIMNPRERILESRSLPNVCKSSRYVIGVIHDGQLHLAPIKSIVQMKDTLAHLSNASDNDIKVRNFSNSEAESEATKVNVKFSQAREQGIKPKHNRSYFHFRRQNDEIPWIKLSYSANSKELENFFASVVESEIPFYCASRKDYLSTLFPKQIEQNPEGTKKKLMSSAPFSELQSLSLQDQLRFIMLKGNVLRYSDVVDILKSKLNVIIDDMSLLRSIQTVAVLVQGCWAVKSDLLYPVQFVSNSHGIPGPIMQKGRDVILSQFNENRMVQRKRLCNLTKLPMDEVTEILTHLATVVPKKGWEFVQTFDTDFVATCRDVVQRQSLMWEMKNTHRERPTSLDFKSNSTESPSKRRSRTVSFSSDTDSGTDSEKNTKRVNRKK